MEHLTLPGTPLCISRVCLGTGSFGTAVPQEEAWKLLDAFYARGGNCADSAHVYAAWIPTGVGASERTLGGWMRSRGVRSSFIISTKGGHPHLDSMHISRLSPAEIAQDLSESLERLQCDTVDLYWLHRDDPRIPVGEIVDALNEHLAAGRVRALGCSNWTTARQQEAAAYARRRGRVGFCASQIGWSLARANAEAAGYSGMLYMDEPTLSYHRATGVPVMAYSSQAGGFFSGKYSRASAADDNLRSKGIGRLYFSAPNFQRLERAGELAGTHGASPNQIALAYLFSQSFPTYAIVGAHTLAQIEDSCAAGSLRLTAEELAYLDA